MKFDVSDPVNILKYTLKFDDLLIQKKNETFTYIFLTFVVLVTNKKGIPFRLKRLTALIEPWITLSSMCIVPLKSIKRPRGLLTIAITVLFFECFYILVCFD